MNDRSLARRVASGGLVLVLLRLSIKFIGLISITVLFRLLKPEDFGLVALGAVVIGFLEVFGQFGFDQSLLRDLKAPPEDYHLVWTLNLLRGLVLSSLLVLLAPLAANFLHDPRLRLVISLLALSSLMDGFQNVGVVDFIKHMEFKREFTLRVSQKVISFVVTLVAAYLLRNYWALVIGQLVGNFFGLVLGYVMHPFRPRPSLAGWRRVMHFSIWLLLNNVILYLGNQTDKVIVQRNFNAQTVGIVRIAEEVSGMVMEVVWPIEKALYAGYVNTVNDIERFRRLLLTGIGSVSAIGVPIALGLGALAHPAVMLLLGEKGRAAIPFVQVYVFHGALRSCLCGIFPAFLVLNLPQINTKVTMVSVAVRLTVLALGFPAFGLMAIPWSMVAGTSTTFLLLWWQLTKVTGMPAWTFPREIWRVMAASGLTYWAANAGLAALSTFVTEPYWQLLILVPASLVLYIGLMALLWRLSGKPDGAERAALNSAHDWLAHRRSAKAALA